ncbi:MAG: oligosaccharide flippase family protein [Candidatus Thiodiazotropha sp. (ex Lucinoma kastoroae)]|nr:oligosaccharide flippase family protein [Candidatus Thiodiazotropha sp. (ex Lucinoma kastoroae)]
MHRQKFLHKFLKGGVSTLLVRALTVISNLTLSMLIARMLAPDQVGVYFLLVSIVSVTALFTQIGLNVALVRIIARSVSRDHHSIVRSSILKSRLLGLLTSLTTALVLYFGGMELLSHIVFKTEAIYDLRLLIVIWVVLWCLESLNAEIFRGFQQYRLAVLFKRLAPNIVIVSIIIFIYLNDINIQLNDYLTVVVFGWFVSIVVSSLLIKNYLLKYNNERGSITIKEILSMSVPLWLTTWITFTLPQLDLWILGIFYLSDTLALYGSAIRLVSFLSIPLLMINAVIPPLIVEAHENNDKEELACGMKVLSALSFFPGLIICIAFFLYGETILRVVFGSHYMDANSVLFILTIGYIFKLFAGSSQQLLMMTGYGRSTMTVSIVSGFILVVGSYLVVEKYGMEGIATVSAITMIIHSMSNLILARVKEGIWVIPVFRLSHVKRHFSFR